MDASREDDGSYLVCTSGGPIVQGKVGSHTNLIGQI